MTLVRTRRPEEAEYEIRLATTPVVVKPGEKFRLTFSSRTRRLRRPSKNSTLFMACRFTFSW